jgi:hypothetical protein
MSVEASTETGCPAGVTPSTPWRVKALTVLPDYRLALTFNDGVQGVADLSRACVADGSGIYEPLKDPEFFSQARLELGVVTWPNGADLDPAWPYDKLSVTEMWSVPF